MPTASQESESPERPAPSGEEAVGETGPQGPASGGGAGRLRLESVVTTASRGTRFGVEVTLADGSRHFTARREGVGDTVVRLRLAAEATLDAAGRAVGRLEDLHLVGIKTLHAFDADMVLVAVRSREAPRRTLLGVVPVTEERERAAAVAALDAVNRVLTARPGARG